MINGKDYRNTEYCPALERVGEQKEELEKKIQNECPRAKIMYNKVKDRESSYHKKFAQIYNEKCAYCGALWGLLPVESFEIDHFMNEASFEDTTEGRIDAGRMRNLVWACISCNRGKRGITLKPPYDELLNTDNGNISSVFIRDKDYSIKICDTYKDDKFIQFFYENLHLGFETRRLDYMALLLNRKYQIEENENKKQVLSESLNSLMQTRNKVTPAGRS